MKVLIYSSKEIYDTCSYEGRAEADLICYCEYLTERTRVYMVTKNRFTDVDDRFYSNKALRLFIETHEERNFDKEIDNNRKVIEAKLRDKHLRRK